MPEFPSRAWMAALCDELESDANAPAIARALDGAYAFVIEPDGPIRERERYDLWVRPVEHGARAEVLDAPAQAPRLTLSAGFGRWWQLVRGELDPVRAVMLRRLKVSGDLRGVARSLDSARPLLAAVRRVEPQWPTR